MPNQQLDLSQLALDRAPQRPPGKAKTTPPPGYRLTRYIFPASILLGLCGLLMAAVGTVWLPKPQVRVVPVIVKRATLQSAGTRLFQAAGWIEPRPTAISVAALAPGVIEELLVVEGQRVAAQEPIARLIAIDAELAKEQARAALAIRQGELAGARAEQQAAKIRLENPLHLQAPLAAAESVLAKTRTELSQLPYLIKTAQANVKFARSNVEGKRTAQAAVAGRVVEQAESEYAAALANLHELQNRIPYLEHEVAAQKRQVDVWQQQLQLLVEERRALAEADAKVESAMALRDDAHVRLRQAELAWQRNVVRAPVDGRILRLVATPGSRVMGMEGTSGQSSSTVVEMYDPNRLQVRADVRLEDVPLLTVGQPVEIETAAAPGVMQGRMLQATSTANIQKNTLEVKVELLDPPESVAPEMLVTATFLAPPTLNVDPSGGESQQLFIPQQLALSTAEGPIVWIVDADNRAQRREVTLGKATPEGLAEVQSGLEVTDKVISAGSENLSEGVVVRVIGEDQQFGLK